MTEEEYYTKGVEWAKNNGKSPKFSEEVKLWMWSSDFTSDWNESHVLSDCLYEWTHVLDGNACSTDMDCYKKLGRALEILEEQFEEIKLTLGR